MQAGHGRWLGDRRQVDGRVPGQEEPNVAVDHPTGRVVEAVTVSRKGGEDRLEGSQICRRKVGKSLGVRRERFSLAVQAFLP